MSKTFEPFVSEPLSSREIEILRLLAQGKSDKEIALSLVLSVQTVKWYNKRLYSKLNVSNRTQAVMAAAALGLLEEESRNPQQALSAAKNNLPAELTSFIGRTREIAEIVDLLKTSRLVTLSGPGGAGKTRLSMQVARSMISSYRDGIFFVGLASVTDPALVAESIAHTLGITEQANQPPAKWLEQALADKHLLLVLDNFEHILTAAPLVTDLLTAAPRLSILTTSREILRLSGEQEFIVPSLLQPLSALGQSVDELSTNESVALFVHRAQAVSQNFHLAEENAETIAAICRRLDGLPLAIELAAARIRLFSPDELLERLESRLNMLVGGVKDLPKRQRTLKDTLDWSFDLLDLAEQRLFAWLSVFRGGFTLEAAEAVTGPELDMEVVDGIGSLLDKSLLYRRSSEEMPSRFFMLETIREYARLKLSEFGQEEMLQDRHLRYFTAFAEKIYSGIWGTEQIMLEQVDSELGNLRAALDWSEQPTADPDLGLRLAISLSRYWDLRCTYNEGRAYLTTLVAEVKPTVPPPILARATFEAGRLAYGQGDYLAARTLGRESVALFSSLESEYRPEWAHSLRMLGDIEVAIGNNDVAAGYIKEALQIFRELQDKEGEAITLWELAWCVMNSGDHELADLYFTQSIAIARQIGGQASLAFALSGQGELAIRREEYERAGRLLHESLALHREIQHTWGIAASLGTLGWSELKQNNLEQALPLLRESLLLRNEIGDAGGIAWCLEQLAEIALLKGQQTSDPQETETFERAAKIFGAAEALRESSGSVISYADQAAYVHSVAVLKGHLSGPGFADAWQHGREMTLDQMVLYALNGDRV